MCLMLCVFVSLIAVVSWSCLLLLATALLRLRYVVTSRDGIKSSPNHVANQMFFLQR